MAANRDDARLAFDHRSDHGAQLWLDGLRAAVEPPAAVTDAPIAAPLRNDDGALGFEGEPFNLPWKRAIYAEKSAALPESMKLRPRPRTPRFTA